MSFVSFKQRLRTFIEAYIPIRKDRALARIEIVHDEVKPLAYALLRFSLSQPEILKWVRGIPCIAVVRADFMYLFQADWSGGTSCTIKPIRGGFYTIDSFRATHTGRSLLRARGTRSLADLFCNYAVNAVKPKSLFVIGADRSAQYYFMKYGLVLREDPSCIIVNPPQSPDMFVYII